MSVHYRYDHHPVKTSRFRLAGIILGGLILVGVVVGLMVFDITRNKSQPASSQSTVQQLLTENSQHMTVDEPLFTFQLPGDWKEIGRKKTPTENSITWQATKKNEENRYLTLHIDIIPATKPINRVLPVTTQGSNLMVGDVSDKCENFTVGGTQNAQEAQKLKPAPAKLRDVNFICNLPGIVDNEVGSGSPEGINTVTVTGTTGGAHKYFFVYTDRNIQPNYGIFVSALESFTAK